jgi:hypothetical protein
MRRACSQQQRARAAARARERGRAACGLREKSDSTSIASRWCVADRCPRVLQDGETALMDAASSGNAAMAVEFVRLGADVNAKDRVRVRRSCARG